MKVKTSISSICLIVILGIIVACSEKPNSISFRAENLVFNTAQDEVDWIYLQLVYAIISCDWQDNKESEESRGYNIGALLVDDRNRPVHWALNSVNSTNNTTQHAEVRVIQELLEQSKEFNLDGYTLYTSLEPCVMCAGMIAFTGIDRLVYGQESPGYGNTFERMGILENDTLNSDSAASYPRQVNVVKSKDQISYSLDSIKKAHPEWHNLKLLTTNMIWELFDHAKKTLNEHQVRFNQNKALLEGAKDFLEDVTIALSVK